MLPFLCSQFLWNLFKLLALYFYQHCSPTEISMATSSWQKSTYFKFPSLAGANNRCPKNRLKNKYICWLFSGYLPQFQESVQELLEPGMSSAMVRLLGLIGPWRTCLRCLTWVFTFIIRLAKLNASPLCAPTSKAVELLYYCFPCRSNK